MNLTDLEQKRKKKETKIARVIICVPIIIWNDFSRMHSFSQFCINHNLVSFLRGWKNKLKYGKGATFAITGKQAVKEFSSLTWTPSKREKKGSCK